MTALPDTIAATARATTDPALPPAPAAALAAPPAATLDPELADRLGRIGFLDLVSELTHGDWLRVVSRLTDPMATDTRANYAAWLRRQATAWAGVRLPAVHVAAADWPLASVRPACLDVVGLIVADLRELSPRNRPSIVPAQPTGYDTPPHGAVVAAALLCRRIAERSAPLLGPAEALSAGTTALGTATRYLSRCADIAERAPGLDHELQEWAARADAHQVADALASSRRFTTRLADALEAATRTGW